MSEQFPPLDRHVAADRAGKRALRAAQEITEALAADGAGAEEPVLLRRGGPHRSIAGLAAVIDEVLADDVPAGDVAADEERPTAPEVPPEP
jgi:hypothetical protein